MSSGIVYLVGLKHTGKTTHGRRLSRRLGWPFYDTDEVIVEIDSSETGRRRVVRGIYREDGAARFRQLEATALALIVEQEMDAVVATGGGVCDNAAATGSLSQGVKVHIRDSLDRLSERVFRRGIPAFLSTDDPAEAKRLFAELFARRVTAYEAMADLTVDTSTLDEESAAAAVVEAVERFLDGR